MFCYSTMETSLSGGSVLNFEGIDPPLLDPGMVELFQTAQKSSGHGSGTTPTSRIVTEGKNLESMTPDELAKLVAQLCEADPSLTEQILVALNISPDDVTQALVPEQCPSPHTPTNSTASPEKQQSPGRDRSCEPAPLHDTSAILKTLNQSLLLQDLTKAIMPSTNSEDGGMSTMNSNLFIMEKQTNTFVPMTNRDGSKKPKYTRKNFSPEQIQGLEAAFQQHRFVRKDLRRQLAKQLSLSERSISYWFQNKRARSKPPITMSSEAARKQRELAIAPAPTTGDSPDS